MNEKKSGKKTSGRLGAVDGFLLLLVLTLLLCSIFRIFAGNLSGLDYTVQANVTFRLENTSKDAALSLRSGDALLLSEDGSEFGELKNITLSGESGGYCNGSGEILLRGAATEAGFLTKAGQYILPYESYSLTNGSCSFSVTVTAVNLPSNP